MADVARPRESGFATASGFYRDVKRMEIGEGTSEIHRNIIARRLGL